MQLPGLISLILDSQPHSQDILLRQSVREVIPRSVVEGLLKNILAETLQDAQTGSLLHLFQLGAQPDIQPDRGLDQVDLTRGHLKVGHAGYFELLQLERVQIGQAQIQPTMLFEGADKVWLHNHTEHIDLVRFKVSPKVRFLLPEDVLGGLERSFKDDWICFQVDYLFMTLTPSLFLPLMANNDIRFLLLDNWPVLVLRRRSLFLLFQLLCCYCRPVCEDLKLAPSNELLPLSG